MRATSTRDRRPSWDGGSPTNTARRVFLQQPQPFALGARRRCGNIRARSPRAGRRSRAAARAQQASRRAARDGRVSPRVGGHAVGRSSSLSPSSSGKRFFIVAVDQLLDLGLGRHGQRLRQQPLRVGHARGAHDRLDQRDLARRHRQVAQAQPDEDPRQHRIARHVAAHRDRLAGALRRRPRSGAAPAGSPGAAGDTGSRRVRPRDRRPASTG